MARSGYDVTLIAPGDKFTVEGCCLVRQDVRIRTLKRRSWRVGRMIGMTFVFVTAALRESADVYHFHDPELIPAGLILRAFGRRVIYDAHEDLPRSIQYKDWIPTGLRRLVGWLATIAEWIAGHALSGIVAATPIIAQRFPSERTALVQNFAHRSDLVAGEAGPYVGRHAVGYVGTVTVPRCAIEVVDAIGRVRRFPDVPLIIVGPAAPSLLSRLEALPGWSRVDYRGQQDLGGVRRALQEARVGLVLYHPLQSYIDAQPVKLFEYMAAGIPVVAADFPRFREIVEGYSCGLCVPPRDVAAIASAIEWIFAHPDEAERMGRRGQELVMNAFNWEREEQTLFALYERVCVQGLFKKVSRE